MGLTVSDRLEVLTRLSQTVRTVERARHVVRMISSEPENREGGFKVCDVGAAKNITTGMHMDIGC